MNEGSKGATKKGRRKARQGRERKGFRHEYIPVSVIQFNYLLNWMDGWLVGFPLMSYSYSCSYVRIKIRLYDKGNK